MRVLVTGSSGYIGPHLVRALRSRGNFVIGIDRLPSSEAQPDLFIQGDLLDEGPLEQALAEEPECIAHLAASRADWGLSDEEYVRDNVWATQRVIEHGRRAQIRRWLVYSSVGVLGSSQIALDDSAPRNPHGAYATSKAKTESLFEDLSAYDPAAQVSVIRPSAVYGPGNPPNTNVYRLIDAIHRRKFVMIGDGQNVKTVSYLPNLIDATLFVMDIMSPGFRTFIYVDSPAETTRDLVGFLAEALGTTIPRWHLPLSVAGPVASTSDLLARLIRVDLPITSARIQKFCRATNFRSTALDRVGFIPSTSSREALRATVRWYLDTHAPEHVG
jgi:nucleoside-diphosphate-sugar epimerase